MVEDDVVERDVLKPKKEDIEAAGAISIMFWIFVVLIVIAIIAGYTTETRVNLQDIG